MPSKCKSGGKKRRQNSKVTAKSATTQISGEKGMVAESATTYHIQGAGAPAKTKNYVNADAFIFFREKVRPFPHLAKPISRTFGKDEKSNGTDKKRLV